MPPARPPAAVDPATPTEATLGFPIYPTSQFIASYDAGRAQRYYIFGSTAPFNDLVSSTDRQTIQFPAGHIGLAVGSKAQRELWPQVCEWLAVRSEKTDIAQPAAEQVRGLADRGSPGE